MSNMDISIIVGFVLISGFVLAAVYFGNVGIANAPPLPDPVQPPILKEPKAITKPGTYRIVPEGESSFRIEQYLKADVWRGIDKSYVYRWYDISDYISYSTEEEAESVIKQLLLQDAEEKARKQRIKDHAAAHPPREIPPFKFIRS